jgi:predicted ATPase/DNA-binding CsgD family transcriptional regulator
MSTREPTPFATLLLHYRAAAHLTQEQLADRAGLSPDTISALERGKRRIPRSATVELLAGALELEAQERAHFTAAAQASEVATPVRSASAGAEGRSVRDTHRHPWWLAMQPTPLVGRAHELDTIIQTLAAEGTRLLTLTGPAGVGKTRLALAAAARLVEEGDRFPDGIALVDLTSVRDPDLVLGAIARALGQMDVGGRTALERLVEALAERRQLLILDNFEQVLPAAASLAQLLATCPGLTLLVTSRVPLRLRSERTLRVAPLPVPDLSLALPPPAVLLAIPAVELFMERAWARQADFAFDEQQAQLVAQLVVQLDGLPLALELAAARLDVLPLPTLARRLGDRLHILASGAPDAPERQQSLEAAVGWSYDLLSEPERLLFRCLGVFVGRVTFDAITAVVEAVSLVGRAGSEASDGEVGQPAKGRETWEAGRTLPHLLSLAEKSLVLPLSTRPKERWEKPLGQPSQQWHDGEGLVDEAEVDEDQEPAFGMLETVREYAWEKLAAADELVAAQRAHAHYFLALAERAAPNLRGRGQRAWHLRLEREHDNLRAALRWLLDEGDCDDRNGPDGANAASEREAGLRLAGALGYFWYVRGYHTEGRRWLEKGLALAPHGESGTGVDSAARTRALIASGPLLMVQAEYTQAQEVLREALALARQRQDPTAIAEASTYLGHATVVAGDVEEGMQWLQEAVRRSEALDDPHGLGEALFYLGYAADVKMDTAAAAAHYTAALGALGDAGNAQHAGFVHSYLGVVEWRRGNLLRAVTQIEAVLRTSVNLQDRWLLSFAAQATAVLVGSHAQTAGWARLLGAADALAQATGGATFGWEHLPGAYDVAGLREHLVGEEEWGAAYHEGWALPFGEVAALALRLLEEVATPASGAEAVGEAVTRTTTPHRESLLTEREREVLRLVAQGLSSKAIGRALFISERTVAQHLTAIFNKLGVSTRAHAVAVAAQRGLL